MKFKICNSILEAVEENQNQVSNAESLKVRTLEQANGRKDTEEWKGINPDIF